VELADGAGDEAHSGSGGIEAFLIGMRGAIAEVDATAEGLGGDRRCRVLDTTRNMISPADLEELKARPEAAGATRWIPLLIAEIERLRALLTEREVNDTPH
jgi:hypothetical protein